MTTDTDQQLVIRGLRVAPVAAPEHEILQGIDLTVGKGEVHAIMGPNGSGKTTLAYALMGHPAYVVNGGEVLWKGRDILKLSPGQARPARPLPRLPVPDRDPRPERRELHPLGPQRQAPGHRQGPRHRPDRRDQGRRLDARLPQQDAREDGAAADGRGLRQPLRQRGFSGGEKKRLEMLQMAVLEPEMAILDETDSGLDIDALRIVAEGVNAMLNPNLGVLLITHYQRLLNYITPDFVHVLAAGPDRQVAAARSSRSASRTRATARSCARPAPGRTAGRGAPGAAGARPAPSSKPVETAR